MTERGRAVVIGASVAGLLATAALAGAGIAVTVLDRDQLPEGPEPRRGVPQARHVHAVLIGGQRRIETLVPGFKAALLAAGAQELCWTRDIAAHSLAGWHRPFDSSLTSCFQSRHLLEACLRQAVMALAGVEVLVGHEAVGLIGDLGRIEGVRCRVRGAEDIQMMADLVVDASGRDSRAADWLQALGGPAVVEHVVDPHLGYATRMYRPPAGYQPGWKAMLARSYAQITRAAGIAPIEDGNWLVTLAGFSRDYPPQDEAGFLDFVRSLGVPEIVAPIEAAEPLSGIVGYRRTTNRWRRYDLMDAWPEGFVAIGDSVCALNPYYGQGMTVAAASALSLGSQVTVTGAPGLAAAPFQRGLARLLTVPWTMATTEECRYPATEGAPRGLRTRIGLWYVDRVLARATFDSTVMRVFLGVSHLTAPTGDLVRPRVLVPVLFRPSRGVAEPMPFLKARAG